MSILYQYPLLSYALQMVLIPAACYGYYQAFLCWLFRDPGLDPAEGYGRLIFLHESHHIRHRHTLDVLALITQ